MKKDIAIIIATLNEENNVNILFDKIKNLLKNDFSWEVIFVDDGSHDKTLDQIKNIRNENNNDFLIKRLNTRGLSSALIQGALFSNSKYILFMDADLQHPPSAIPKMVQQWKSGHKVVTAQRKSIKYSIWREIGSNFFYFMLNNFSKLNLQQKATDFRLLDKQVVKVIKDFPERNRFFRGIIDWVGFKKTSITFGCP